MRWCPVRTCLPHWACHWNPLLSRMRVGPELWLLAYKWLELWHQYFVRGFKYNSSLLQIYLEARISKNFWVSIYFWRFTSARVREGRCKSMACFPTFSSYIYYALLVSSSARNQAKTTKYNKSRILRYFIIFISWSFWKLLERKC